VWPALLFVALALVWTFPLAAHLSSRLPGEGAGDNIAFLWNFWWMRQALAHPALSFFHTDRLFVPFGIDLTLHTHTALPAFIGATILAPLSTIAAQNVMILATLAFNGFAAYLLAFDRTRDRAAAAVGGVIFAGSPYIAGHMLGHFNLIGAWGIPLFVMYLLRALERRSVRFSLAAGLTLIAVAYTDYYYVVYCAVLAVMLALWSVRPLAAAPRRVTVPEAIRAGVLLVLALDAVLIAAILATGGFTVTVGALHVVARRTTNLLAIAWGVLALWGLLHYRVRIRAQPVERALALQHLRTWTPLVLVAAAGITPLVLNLWHLWSAGDYTAPLPSWRSGPGGIDLATLVLGNPMHPISGAWTRRVYEQFGVNTIEGVGWLGIVPPALVWIGAARHARDPEVRRWLVIATVFFVWALGPWLRIAGFDTGLLLPQNVFAHIPLLSNARMPGRAIVVVFMAGSVLASIVLSRTPAAFRRRAIAAALILIGADYLPAPFPLTPLGVPALYSELGGMEGGSICELPMGIRDGFGSTGIFDDRVLLHQMTHAHPIVGGFAARVPPSIKKGYDEIPVLRSLLRLSAGKTADPADTRLSMEQAGVVMRDAGIRFIVLNHAVAPAALVAYVQSTLPIQLLRTEGPLELYALTGAAQTSALPLR
jgi:hypothetical protein